MTTCIEAKLKPELFSISVEQVVCDGWGDGLFETGVNVFDMLVVVRVENAKIREPLTCIEDRV